MTRPEMTCEIAVSSASEPVRTIYFYATPDAAQDVAQFGDVEAWAHKDQYQLTVDARYSFGEVLAYIAQYGKVEA